LQALSESLGWQSDKEFFGLQLDAGVLTEPAPLRTAGRRKYRFLMLLFLRYGFVTKRFSSPGSAGALIG
jgi:hypothetical protein